MNLTTWVDVALGLTIVYLGTSLFVTITNEYIAQFFNLRGRNLFNALKQLIEDKELRTALQAVPTLKPYFEEPNTAFKRLRGPSISYVDTKVLAQMLLGFIASPPIPTPNPAQLIDPPPDSTPSSRSGATPQSVLTTTADMVADVRVKDDVLRKVEGNVSDTTLKAQLQAVVHSASNSMESITQAISGWADRSLTMLGEDYKRNMQILSFVVSLAIASLFNIDTVTLVEHLYNDKDLRSSTAEFAVRFSEQNDRATFDRCMKLSNDDRKKDDTCKGLLELVDALQSKNQKLEQLPIGWSTAETKSTLLPALSIWESHVVGWILTALAASLGAPFWFDILSRLVNVRHGMKRPETAETETK